MFGAFKLLCKCIFRVQKPRRYARNGKLIVMNDRFIEGFVTKLGQRAVKVAERECLDVVRAELLYSPPLNKEFISPDRILDEYFLFQLLPLASDPEHSGDKVRNVWRRVRENFRFHPFFEARAANRDKINKRRRKKQDLVR